MAGLYPRSSPMTQALVGAWPKHLQGNPDDPEADPMAHKVGAAVTGVPVDMAKYLISLPQRAIEASEKSFAPDGSYISGNKEAADVASEIATALMGGGAVRQFGKGAANELGIFGGRMAKTAPLDDLTKAEAMEKAGAYPDEIWEQTGWGRAADGEWRFEIDDSAATVRNADTLAPLDKNLWHPRAFEAYPDARSIESYIGNSPQMKGEFGKTDAGEGLNAFGPNSKDQTSVALHEMQHALQKRENFARGGSPSKEFTDDLINQLPMIKSVDEKIAKLEKQAVPLLSAADEFLSPAEKAIKDEYQSLIKLSWTLRSSTKPYDLYRRLGGEVEARNVQKRMNMTAAERREMPPVFTEDVPRSQQIIRRK